MDINVMQDKSSLAQVQMDIFDTLTEYDLALASAKQFALDRFSECIKLYDEWISAWVVGANGLLPDVSGKLYNSPSPMVSCPYRFGLDARRKFKQSSATKQELKAAEKKMLEILSWSRWG